MLITENALAYSMMEMFRANNKVTDSLDIRLFKDWVKEARALILKQRLDTNNGINESWIQDLEDVEMEQVDSSIYSTVPSGRYMLRSVKDIPFTIGRKNSIGTFVRVGPADRLDIKYNVVSYDRALFSGNGRFNNNDVYAFLDGSKLCLISKSNLHKLVKRIHIRGVFVNPQEAYEFTNGANTWDGTQYYPVSQEVVTDIKTIIMDKNLKFALVQAEDKVDDGADETTVTRLK